MRYGAPTTTHIETLADVICLALGSRVPEKGHLSLEVSVPVKVPFDILVKPTKVALKDSDWSPKKGSLAHFIKANGAQHPDLTLAKIEEELGKKLLFTSKLLTSKQTQHAQLRYV